MKTEGVYKRTTETISNLVLFSAPSNLGLFTIRLSCSPTVPRAGGPARGDPVFLYEGIN